MPPNFHLVASSIAKTMYVVKGWSNRSNPVLSCEVLSQSLLAHNRPLLHYHILGTGTWAILSQNYCETRTTITENWFVRDFCDIRNTRKPPRRVVAEDFLPPARIAGMERPSRPVAVGCAVIAVLVLIPLVYVLSIGPAYLMADQGWLNPSAVDTVYRPLWGLAADSPTFVAHRFYDYVDLWTPVHHEE